MIKISNIVLIGTLVVAAAVVIPKAKKCIDLNHSIKTVEASIATTNTELLGLSEKLKAASDKCVDIQVSSNYDVAKTIAGFKGSKIKSIASLITKNGQPYKCSEVTAPEDVNFFNDAIEKIEYTLSVKDAKSFVNSLNMSAIAVDSLKLDSEKGIAVLTVSSISSAISQAAPEVIEGGEE